jgi:hypothetical protein
MKEALSNFHMLAKRMSILEEENHNLRTHNKNLVKFLSNSKFLKREEYDIEEHKPIPDASPFNTVYNSINNTSSVEMNQIVNNNLERRRFLIPKE